MDNKELVDLLTNATNEVTSLRERLAIIEPQARAFAVVATIVEMLPQKSQGQSVDVVWRMRAAIEQLSPVPVGATTHIDD